MSHAAQTNEARVPKDSAALRSIGGEREEARSTMNGTKEYLGDSVYVEFDGYGIVLTTENGHLDDPRNRIVLEPNVLVALNQYVERLKTRLAASSPVD